MAKAKANKQSVRRIVRTAYPDYEQPMAYKVAANLLGISVDTLKYHIRKGRIRKAMIPGAKYAIGVIAADVRAIVNPSPAKPVAIK